MMHVWGRREHHQTEAAGRVPKNLTQHLKELNGTTAVSRAELERRFNEVKEVCPSLTE